MISNWREQTLGEVCVRITDGAHNSPRSVSEGLPMASVKDLTPFGINLSTCRLISEEDYEVLVRQGCRPEVGDVLISKDGASALDTVCEIRSSIDAVLLSSVAILRPDPSIISSSYLHYYLDAEPTRQYMKNSFTTGAAIPRVVLQDFKRTIIRFPPLPTQRKIAAILSAYDDLIENNLRRIAILEEVARLLYREWFVNFRFPGHKSVPFVNSTLGPIPEGWEAKRLGDVVELAYGKGLKADHRIDGPVPVYGSGGIIGYHNESMVKGPGIIVGRKGNVGSVFWSYEDFFPIDTVFFVQTQTCLHYVYYNLQTQNFINNDAAVPGLSRNQAYLLPFLLPDKKTLDSFQHLTDTFFRQIRNLESRNTNLRATRDLLLPRLISGDLDISDLSIVTGEELDLELQPVQSRLF